GDDLLRLRRVEEVEIGFCQLPRAAVVHNLVDDGDRKFGKQAEGGHDNVELVLSELLGDAARLGFEGNQYVADLPLHKGRRCGAAARVEHWHVVEQLGHEFADLGL